MRTLLNLFSGLTLATCCLLLAGCSSPNVRQLGWDHVGAKGFLKPAPVVYSRVNIDLENVRQDFRVRMPNGTILLTSQITPAVIEPYAMFGHPKLSDVSQGTRYFNVIFHGTTWNPRGGYTFEFENGKLVGLNLGMYKRPVPETSRPSIGKANETEMHTLPFTEEQLVNLFGPYKRQADVKGGL
jgi:hypothetical protein